MPTPAYYEALSRVQHLPDADQLRLLEKLVATIRRPITIRPRRSIMELQGLGKEIWRGMDAQEYVNRERDSWNG